MRPVGGDLDAFRWRGVGRDIHVAIDPGPPRVGGDGRSGVARGVGENLEHPPFPHLADQDGRPTILERTCGKKAVQLAVNLAPREGNRRERGHPLIHAHDVSVLLNRNGFAVAPQVRSAGSEGLLREDCLHIDVERRPAVAPPAGDVGRVDSPAV